MNRRVVLAVLLLIFGLIGISLLLFWTERRESMKVDHSVPVAEPTPSFGDRQLAVQKHTSTETFSQLPAVIPDKYDPTLPQWQEWRRRNKEDKKWEWKTPIVFYGRVLDQDNNPVVGAKVTFSWTDLSQTGTSLREVQTDSGGNIVLRDVQGKHLVVRSIEKDNYQDSAQNRKGFEYAAFFDSSYHIPDPKNPVLFRMHKKTAAEPLIVRSNEIKIPANGSVGINLLTGRQDASEAHLMIDLLDNSDRTGRRWMARLRVPDGGIQMAGDEFARIAPDSGYMPEIVIDQDTTQMAGFQGGNLYKGGRFFVKTVLGYALVEFRMIPGNLDLQTKSYLNPNTSSRNLEYDPAAQAKNR